MTFVKIIYDYHLHSSASADCVTDIEEMIQSGIKLGLQHMTFTEHVDIGYPGDLDFSIDYDTYIKNYHMLKEKYKDQISLGLGVEVGLQPQYLEDISEYVKKYPFDFVLASTHVVHGQDPYFGQYYKGKTLIEAYEGYFEETYEMLLKYDNFDSYAHLDYIIRYAPVDDKMYHYKDLAHVLDPLLELIIKKDKALEVNTSGYRNGFNTPHPQIETLKRYYELGGRKITVGSDAHLTGHITHSFDHAYNLLTTIGFNEITVFHKRQPSSIALTTPAEQ